MVKKDGGGRLSSSRDFCFIFACTCSILVAWGVLGRLRVCCAAKRCECVRSTGIARTGDVGRSSLRGWSDGSYIAVRILLEDGMQLFMYSIASLASISGNAGLQWSVILGVMQGSDAWLGITQNFGSLQTTLMKARLTGARCASMGDDLSQLCWPQLC